MPREDRSAPCAAGVVAADAMARPEFVAAAARMAAALMVEETASEASIPAAASAAIEWEASAAARCRHNMQKIQALAGWLLLWSYNCSTVYEY